ncbi:MAG: purine-binding chemotaxis protein CheW [Halobacteriovoraceae bacterium]|nr:purine-binding chemotaxis protein CheW [Halobacteriovoraceae bacterium]
MSQSSEQVNVFSISEDEEVDENKMKYLVFWLQGERYGAPLLTVKEVLRTSEIKKVPYMVDHFKGVINLRGQIVSVIDLRARFGLSSEIISGTYILVFETNNGLLGAIVDEIDSVIKIEDEDVDTNPLIETKVPIDFFIGVGKLSNGLVNMVDISKCISEDDLRLIKKANG